MHPSRQRTTHDPKPSVSRWALVAIFATAIVFAGCATLDEPPAESGSLGIGLSALSSSCGGEPGTNPFPKIAKLRLVVRGDDLDTSYEKVANFSGSSKDFEDTAVPAGNGREITLVGLDSSGSSKWFARRSGLSVPKNKATEIDMTLMAVSDFTCLGLDQGSMANVVFPSIARMGNRVLITGGFGVASDVSGKLTIGSAQQKAFIFDTYTGTLEQLPGLMKTPRGAHSSVYLPKLNKVLIVGGAQEMTSDTKGPPEWNVSKGVNVPYELFDVTTGEFEVPVAAEGGPALHTPTKRVFPNLMLLSDDYVVSLGGGVWPSSKISDPETYASSDLFDPTVGAFVNPKGSLPLQSARAGAAVAFVGTTPLGTSKYLIWQGTNSADKAEIFRESSTPGTGVFEFELKIKGSILEKTGGLYFSSLTRIGTVEIGEDKHEGVLFLSAGGVRYDGGWKNPDPTDVYLVTLDEQTSPPSLDTQAIGPLTMGLYMHGTTLTDDTHVLLSGGFSAFGSATEAALKVFSTTNKTLSDPPAAEKFVKRGGHGALRLGNDCVLFFGGVTEFADLKTNHAAVSDVYCPAHLVPGS